MWPEDNRGSNGEADMMSDVSKKEFMGMNKCQEQR